MRAALLFVLGSSGLLPATQQPPPPGTRNVYLNGVDVSSAKNQELRNVDVTINERGDIFIVAPHYQVHEEDTYVPLSKYVQTMNTPEHRQPQQVGAGRPQPTMAVHPKGLNSDAQDTPGLLPKAGRPLPQPGAEAEAKDAKPDEKPAAKSAPSGEDNDLSAELQKADAAQAKPQAKGEDGASEKPDDK